MLHFNNIKFLLIIILSLNCNNDTNNLSNTSTQNKFKEAKEDFEEAKKEFEKCKTQYELKSGHKVVVDIKNGSGVKGIAKEFSEYLKENCYDTFYGNWSNFNEYTTYAILHKRDEMMVSELINLLDKNIPIEITQNERKLEDITLVIGKDYKKLNFYNESQ
tara:strand:+ start:44 stop:526 length:483 start_codon:yes stop_codon:yes gene_type:complete